MKKITFFMLLFSTICSAQNISIIVTGDDAINTEYIELKISVEEGLDNPISSNELIGYCKKNNLKYEIVDIERRRIRKFLVIKEINQNAYVALKEKFGESFTRLIPLNIEPKNEKEIKVKLYRSLIEKAKEEADLVCQSLNKKRIEVAEVNLLEQYKRSVKRHSDLKNFEWQTLYTKLEVVFKVVE